MILAAVWREAEAGKGERAPDKGCEGVRQEAMVALELGSGPRWEKWGNCFQAGGFPSVTRWSCKGLVVPTETDRYHTKTHHRSLKGNISVQRCQRGQCGMCGRRAGLLLGSVSRFWPLALPAVGVEGRHPSRDHPNHLNLSGESMRGRERRDAEWMC